jgi:hypothetical protein
LDVLLGVGGRGRSREQEGAGRLAVVDGSTNGIPRRRHALPLVEQDWPGGVKDPSDIRARDLLLRGIVEADNGGRATLRGGRLSNAFGTFDCDCRERPEDLVEFVVYDC